MTSLRKIILVLSCHLRHKHFLLYLWPRLSKIQQPALLYNLPLLPLLTSTMQLLPTLLLLLITTMLHHHHLPIHHMAMEEFKVTRHCLEMLTENVFSKLKYKSCNSSILQMVQTKFACNKNKIKFILHLQSVTVC
jgi:hypothetical protein